MASHVCHWHAVFRVTMMPCGIIFDLTSGGHSASGAQIRTPSGARRGHDCAQTGKLAGLPFVPHPHQLRHAYGYYLASCGHDTRAIQNSIWDIRTFSIRCDTLRWHRTDLKASGMIKLCRFSNGIGEKSYTKPSSLLDTDCTFAPIHVVSS